MDRQKVKSGLGLMFWGNIVALFAVIPILGVIAALVGGAGWRGSPCAFCAFPDGQGFAAGQSAPGADAGSGCLPVAAGSGGFARSGFSGCSARCGHCLPGGAVCRRTSRFLVCCPPGGCRRGTGWYCSPALAPDGGSGTGWGTGCCYPPGRSAHCRWRCGRAGG